MRTTSLPLGPNLNSASSYGITDQKIPLVGYDVLTVDGKTGYWPLFASTSANLYVDTTTSHWVSAYSDSGALIDPVQCNSGEAIIGIKFYSHRDRGAGANPLPDIQCAPLLPVAQVKAVDVNSVDTRNITVNDDGTGTIKTSQSVTDVQQCMIDATSTFAVQNLGSGGSTINTCQSRMTPTVTITSSTGANVLLVEYLMSIEPQRQRRGFRGPEIVDFMVQRDPITADSLFGDDTAADTALTGNIKAAQQTSVNKASAEYVANWGGSAPTVDQVKAELGPTPWSSDQLLAGSAEFITGSLTGGDKIRIIRGFKRSDPNSLSNSPTATPVQMVCGTVFGCAHGSCSNGQCQCKPGFSGPSCMDRLDPCGDRPCGDYGICSEDFSSNATSGNFICKCNDGWSGPTCGVTSNACLTQITGRWKNVDCGQGQCVDNGNSTYACQCSPGWAQSLPALGVPNATTVPKCDVQKTDCVGQWWPGLCDSTCTQTDTFYISIPQAGSGAACPTAMGATRNNMCTGGQCKQCMSRDCNGRGRCSDSTGICQCSDGWKGSNCELSTSICSTTLCSGHGNCDSSQTSCTCMNGWSTSDAMAAVGQFCGVDPCAGCPPGRCNVDTGTCSCLNDLPDPAYPACGRMGAVDCVGKWSALGACSTTCEQKRYFSIATPASSGGKGCSNRAGDFQTGPCSAGGCCQIQPAQCLNGATFIAASCECRCPVGFQGTFCQTSSSTADRVITKEVAVDATTLALFNTTLRPEVTYEVAMAAEAVTQAPAAEGVSMYVYIGAGVGGLLLLGAIGYFMTKKKPAPATDPLLAGMEGMEGLEGMDLTGMDLSALGMDGTAPPPNPM